MGKTTIFLLIFAASSQAQAWPAWKAIKGLCQSLLVRQTVQAEVKKIKSENIGRSDFDHDDLWIQKEHRDPTWVMNEALKTYEELRALPVEQRNKQTIEYFRKQLPTITQYILRGLSVPLKTPYWMVDKEGQRIDNGVETLDQAVKLLAKEGADHYFARDVSLEWFPQYVLEVVGLRWFLHRHDRGKWVMPKPEQFREWLKLPAEQRMAKQDIPERYVYCMMNYKRDLEIQRNAGALHWPTVAFLNSPHFRDWHKHIKSLGYAENGFALAAGVLKNDFDGYGYDIDDHELPPAFIPYKERFESVMKYFELRAKEEQFVHQVLLNMMMFKAGHETQRIYQMFVQLMENPQWNLEMELPKALAEVIYPRGDIKPFVEFIQNRLNQELPLRLKELAPQDMEEETKYAYRRFVKIMTQAFQQQPIANAEARRLRE